MKILFADDDDLIRRLIVYALRKAGYSVEAVKNRDELLEKLESDEIFDVVITDNSMPNFGEGIEVLQFIRDSLKFRSLPVIVHSSDTEIQEEVENLGGVFVAKAPAPFENLVAALNPL